MSEEYSVGPLPDETWLTIYEMVSRAWADSPEMSEDRYWDAREAFLEAHPEDAIKNPTEEWSDEMKEAWDETMMEMFEDE